MVGAVGLGCPILSLRHAAHPEADARGAAVVRGALDLGLTLLATSDSPVANELLVGRALQGRRDQAVLATTVGLVTQPDGTAVRSARPEHVRLAVDHSLRRLRTDRVDLLVLAAADPAVPLEETWGAMGELVGTGKVRALATALDDLPSLRRVQSVFPVTAVVADVSLLRPRPDLVAWCHSRASGLLATGSLGHGVLVGRSDAPDPAPHRRHPWAGPATVRPDHRTPDAVRRIANRHGVAPATVALAWLLGLDPAVVPLPGTTSAEHLAALAAAVDLVLDNEDRADLDRATRPHP